MNELNTTEKQNLAKLNQARKPQENKSKEKEPSSIGKISEISGIEFMLVLFLAIAKDGLDGIETASAVLSILVSISNVFVVLALWLWFIIRLHKFPTKRFVGGVIIESIPFVAALPFWTGAIISIYLEQKGYLPKQLTQTTKLAKP